MVFKVFLMTCDESQYILPVTTYLINKYYRNTNIYCLGYTKPKFTLPSNVNFIELKNGQKRNKSEWFNDIYKYLSSVKDEYIMFSVDDHPPIDLVDDDSMKFIKNLLENNKDIALIYGGTTHARGQICLENDKYAVWYTKNTYNHKTNLQLNIWKREVLLEILKGVPSNLTTFETAGINRIQSSKYKNYKILGITKKNQKGYKQCILAAARWSLCSESYMGPNRTSIIGLKNEDVNEIVKQKLIDKNNLVYSMSRSKEIPFHIFSGNFNFNKLRAYVKQKGWSENNLGHSYNIKIWEDYYDNLHNK